VVLDAAIGTRGQAVGRDQGPEQVADEPLKRGSVGGINGGVGMEGEAIDERAAAARRGGSRKRPSVRILPAEARVAVAALTVAGRARKLVNMKALKAIYVDERLHRRVKLLAVRSGRPLKDIVEALLDGALRERSPDARVSTRDLQGLAARGGSFDFWQDDRQNVYSLHR
jgi:hypothetical protein